MSSINKAFVTAALERKMKNVGFPLEERGSGMTAWAYQKNSFRVKFSFSARPSKLAVTFTQKGNCILSTEMHFDQTCPEKIIDNAFKILDEFIAVFEHAEKMYYPYNE